VATSGTLGQAASPTPVVARRKPWIPAEDRRLVGALQIGIGLVVLALWELAIAVGLAQRIIFSSPVLIAERMVSMVGGEIVYGRTIFDHIGVTLQQIMIGYAMGASSAIVAGYVFGRVRQLRKVFEPIILALFSIPKIAIAPLFILVLGIGIWGKIGIVFIEVFFVVFFNTLKGVMEVNEEYVNIARIMGASRRKISRAIIIPAALPSIFIGLKMGVPFAIIGAVLGEYIASNQGLGWFILYSTNSFDASGLWAGILFLVAITWGLTQIVNLSQARVLRWQPPRRGRAVAVG
jgi:NitT/TauT family transport system permease protein